MQFQHFNNDPRQPQQHIDGSSRKRKLENHNDSTTISGEQDFFSDILSPEEMRIFDHKSLNESINDYDHFFFDVIKQENDDPIFFMNNYIAPKIKSEISKQSNDSFTTINIGSQSFPEMKIEPSMMVKNEDIRTLQPTYTLDISPKTRVSNNPKDISITVTIKISNPNVCKMKELPDKILLWSSSKKLTEKVTAISEDGVNEVQVDTSSCFVVLMNFDLRDKDDLFVSNCEDHLSKEKQGCQFANSPGPCWFRHVAPLSIIKKNVTLENSSVEALFLTRTFQNLRIDKKGKKKNNHLNNFPF